ncbi:hypothetical protein K402DRAFT_455062 [Aulographum hederae CBS 113979]|uniref:Cyanovirin-N domain-containing protein n=1 Tax=Aulographum hederae CBS 113979 TaxID=1176131 RepID=A0A6G1GX90_9PEZI|nr:hypothetical protein K402DRAFT_455062 [Aulographum hederae CBS 113979]
MLLLLLLSLLTTASLAVAHPQSHHLFRQGGKSNVQKRRPSTFCGSLTKQAPPGLSIFGAIQGKKAQKVFDKFCPPGHTRGVPVGEGACTHIMCAENVQVVACHHNAKGPTTIACNDISGAVNSILTDCLRNCGFGYLDHQAQGYGGWYSRDGSFYVRMGQRNCE